MATSRVPAKEELASEHAASYREEEPNIIRHDSKHSCYISAEDLSLKPAHSQYIRNHGPCEL